MMKRFLFLFLPYLTYAAPLDSYLSYLKQLSESKGSYLEGEIEVVLDPEEILRIQKIQEERLLKKGFSLKKALEFSRIGVVNEDQYLIWLRDAVYFPQKIPGTYDRLIWRNALTDRFSGVAVLPIFPSGDVVLVLNYRHATRSWELELPRGGVKPQESLEDAALRELKEETGLEVASLTFLGNVAPDTGVLGTIVPVYAGVISAEGKSDLEYSEAIAQVLSFSRGEIRDGLLRGSLEVSLNGEKKLVPLRDSFLTFALLQAELRDL